MLGVQNGYSNIKLPPLTYIQVVLETVQITTLESLPVSQYGHCSRRPSPVFNSVLSREKQELRAEISRERLTLARSRKRFLPSCRHLRTCTAAQHATYFPPACCNVSSSKVVFILSKQSSCKPVNLPLRCCRGAESKRVTDAEDVRHVVSLV